MRRVVLCVGLVISLMGLSACGGGGGSSSASNNGGNGVGGTVTQSNITLPTSVQVVSTN